MTVENYDYVIFGAGIYGMYAAKILAKSNRKIALIEVDDKPLQRASFINQARVHNGYHYPRSVSTAEKSAHFYERFNRDFNYAVNTQFKKVYAIALYDSLTNAEQFKKFCDYVSIPAEEINSSKYFNQGTVEAAFETDEYTYDANKIRESLTEELKGFLNVNMIFNGQIEKVEIDEENFKLKLSNGAELQTSNVLNATYASINQLLNLFGYSLFQTKYELCEVILTKVSSNLSNTGITVMDGPFFSLMPFGYSGYHSLTSVSDTPHETSNNPFPKFSCQTHRRDCNEHMLRNCNTCQFRPDSSWSRMSQIAKKYLKSDISVQHESSLYAVKTILSTAEIDDSRPTVIRQSSQQPNFISVFSGKFNTIYDLEEVLL
ncbi:FAD-dependent oxidoreductase [Paenibacillus whitsoniae]|uniref:FAD-binding oxidoreductase n=1 Tax=Paenibacillus whitsoniae TaxID=2496558 RepID=A0A430JAT2_9BACL|nr:FAD-dependent oxidoreductase [Paenibacillus whitsoniae]RTE08159.1 FAD-binding oxidoreductase [Paenibacillus whitsoniae]